MGRITKTGLVLLSSLVLAGCATRYNTIEKQEEKKPLEETVLEKEVKKEKSKEQIFYENKIKGIFDYVIKNSETTFDERLNIRKDLMAYNNLIINLGENRYVSYSIFNYAPFSNEKFGEEDVLRISFFEDEQAAKKASFASYSSDENRVTSYYYNFTFFEHLSELDMIALEFGESLLKNAAEFKNEKNK